MKVVKVGDIGTEHDGFHPTKVTAGSPDVFIDGMPAARVGDPLEPHDKPKHPKHARAIASGSSTVFINGKPAALTGGSISCGGVTIGSGTVNIGDIAPTVTKSAISETSILQNLSTENIIAMNDSDNRLLSGLKNWVNEAKNKDWANEVKEFVRFHENELAAWWDAGEYAEYSISEVHVNNTLGTFQVYCDGKLQATYPVESGRPGVTDFLLKGQGPIPPGEYYVDPSEISEVHYFSYLIRWYNGDWGNARVRLHPAQNTNTFGRDNFFIHGGLNPGSAGCLDIGSNDMEFFTNLKECSGKIKVVVMQ